MRLTLLHGSIPESRAASTQLISIVECTAASFKLTKNTTVWHGRNHTLLQVTINLLSWVLIAAPCYLADGMASDSDSQPWTSFTAY